MRAAVTETGRMRTPDMTGADEWTAWKYLRQVSFFRLRWSQAHLQWQVILGSKEDKAMNSTYNKAGDVRSMTEDFEWHKGMLRKALLGVEKKQGHESAEDDQTDHRRRVPGKCLPPKV